MLSVQKVDGQEELGIAIPNTEKLSIRQPGIEKPDNEKKSIEKTGLKKTSIENSGIKNNSTDKSMIINALANKLVATCDYRDYMSCLGIQSHQCYQQISIVMRDCSQQLPNTLSMKQVEHQGKLFTSCLQTQMQSRLKISNQQMDRCRSLMP